MAANMAMDFFMSIEEEIKQTKFRNPFHKVAINILFTASWLENNNKEFFKLFGLTPQQFNILRILRGRHPKETSVAEIKDRMIDRNSDVSRLVDRLTSKNLAVKGQCRKDKRAADVLITSEGLNLLRKIDTKMDQTDQSLFKLSAAEADQLNALLDKTRG